MTKKDYIAIARALKNAPLMDSRLFVGGFSDRKFIELPDVVAALATVFKQDNSKFDADRFKDAVLK